ncbi:hypothetical protein CFC21_025864, partial [Triticum aestivum]
AAAAAAEEE